MSATRVEAEAPPSSPTVDWVRARRKSLDLTQEDVVRRLDGIGLTISRGYFAALEQGRGFKPDHVVALDYVLDGGGALIEVAEHEWGQPVRSSFLRHWARLGEGIHEDWVQLAASATRPAEDPSQRADSATILDADEKAVGELEKWWESLPDGEVFKSTRRIERAVVYLLTLAAQRTEPQLRPPIELSGAFEGFRTAGQRAGLPRLVRNALRDAMEKGWRCRHYVPMNPDDVDATTLVYVALPLIACPNFTARTVDLSRVPVMENLLIIPGLATVQFFATTTTRDIDAAVIHKRPDTRGVIAQRVKQIASATEHFYVQRYERSRAAKVTENEAAFQRLLTDVAQLPGDCYVLAGELPSSTIPPVAYKRGVTERSKKAHSTDDPIWKTMRELQQERVDLLEAHLKNYRVRVIVTTEMLAERTKAVRGPDDDHTKVYLPLKGQIEHLEHVKKLMNDHRGKFEVGIADEDLAPRVKRLKWEVRDNGATGALVVHTDYTPPVTNELGRTSSETAQVDLKVESPAAVKAFSSFFREMWANKTDTDFDSVNQRLNEIIAALKIEDQKRT
jgi:transcriptional regulator with XRE-family HTH domain